MHAERVAPFGSSERFRTEEPIFWNDTCEATDAAANGPVVTGDQYTGSTDQTTTKTVDVESEDGGDMELTPVDDAARTPDS